MSVLEKPERPSCPSGSDSVGSEKTWKRIFRKILTKRLDSWDFQLDFPCIFQNPPDASVYSADPRDSHNKNLKLFRLTNIDQMILFKCVGAIFTLVVDWLAVTTDLWPDAEIIHAVLNKKHFCHLLGKYNTVMHVVAKLSYFVAQKQMNRAFDTTE